MNETLTRAISGMVYVAILLFACWYSELGLKILMGIFLVLATVEFIRLVKLNDTIAFFIAIGFYSIFGFFDNLEDKYDVYIVLFSILTAFWLIGKLFFAKNVIQSNTLSKYLVFIGYIVFAFVLITKIPKIGNKYVSSLIISIFVLIWINDTFAYLVGKSIGKHKLLKHISPKKTIEGFLGGAIFVIISGILMQKYFFLEDAISKWIIMSIIIVVFSTLGDLIESKFKRSAGVKDSGNILPGHGGILDRLDSIIFVAPFLFLFLKIIKYVS